MLPMQRKYIKSFKNNLLKFTVDKAEKGKEVC